MFIQSNFNDSNTDGSFNAADSKSFFGSLENASDSSRKQNFTWWWNLSGVDITVIHLIHILDCLKRWPPIHILPFDFFCTHLLLIVRQILQSINWIPREQANKYVHIPGSQKSAVFHIPIKKKWVSYIRFFKKKKKKKKCGVRGGGGGGGRGLRRK